MTISDYGSGWLLSSSKDETKSGAITAHISVFANTSNTSTVTTEVAVYPDVATAHQVYLGEVPQNMGTSNPNKGDESFSTTFTSLLQKLVFRKANVVAWITVANDPYGSPNHAADVVLSRIN